MAVPQEGDGVLDGPDVAFGCRGAGDDRGPGGIAAEAAVSDGLAEGAGEGGQDPVNGDRPAAVCELVPHEGGDVCVAEVVELDVPEGGDEVGLDVGTVAGHGGRFQRHGLGLEPGSQVVADRLVRIGEEPVAVAGDQPPQSLRGIVLRGKPPRRTVRRR